MTVRSIPSDKAWSEGAELWVLSREPSSFLERTDWLLNFQLSNSMLHKSQQLRPETLEIIERTGLSSPDSIKGADLQPLLVAARQFVPASWVMIMNDVDENNKQNLSPEDWAQAIQKKWALLAKPSVRIFLPKSFEPSRFEKSISKLFDDGSDISLVTTGHLKAINPSADRV